MATLGTTTFDDCPAGAGAHAGAETVLALAAAYVWLIGAFHERNPDRGVERTATGYEVPREVVKGDLGRKRLGEGPFGAMTSPKREKFSLAAKERIGSIRRIATQIRSLESLFNPL